MPKLSESARAVRRGRILDSAVDCFAHAGYHATTMGDVAAAAGVSKGTPYLYFASKEELFVALHDEWGCGLSARIETAVATLPEDERDSPRGTLRAVMIAVGDHVTDRPEACRVLMEARTLAAYHPAIAASVRAGDDRNRALVEELIRAGVAAGEWPAGTSPRMAARLFLATIDGLMGQWHSAPLSISWHEAASTLTGALSFTAAGSSDAI